MQGLLASASPGAQPAELDGIYASLPGHEASIRAISLPRAVWKRGEKALLAELEGAVPFDVDDAVVDAQVTAPCEGAAPGCAWAMAYATPPASDRTCAPGFGVRSRGASRMALVSSAAGAGCAK